MATKGQLRDKDARNIYPVTKSDLVIRPGGGDVEAALAALEGGRGLRKLFEAAGAKYNESTGFYELNGFTDISEAEMVKTYQKTNNWWLSSGQGVCSGVYGCRTNIVPHTYTLWSGRSQIFYNSFINTDFKKVVLTSNNIDPISFSSLHNFLLYSSKTVLVEGIMNIANVKDSTAHIAGKALESITLKNLNTNFKIGACGSLNLESFTYMVDNRLGDNSITVTVHPDVMAKFEDAEGHPEWHALMQQAAEKQIRFATE